MRKMRAQASVEFSLTLGIQLFIIAVLLVVFSGIFVQISQRSNGIVAADSVGVLSHAARAAWQQGPGAILRVQATLPETTDLPRSFIGNRTLAIYLSGFGHVSEGLAFNISGSWPNSTGAHMFDVENMGSRIEIRPAFLLRINISAIYVSINKSASNTSSAQFRLINRMPFDYNITPTYTCASPMSCILNPSSVYPLNIAWPEDESISTLSIDAISASPGIYAGHINLTANTTQGGPNSTLVIPITIRVYQ